MNLLNEQQIDDVAEAISEVERHTDAELVTVLAGRADSYLYIPTLWAGIAALLTPIVLKLTPFWLSSDELFVAQWLVFAVLAMVLRWQPLMMRLVPRGVKEWRASSLARRQFLDNNLHHTKGDTGVLIFVSEAEHYVEILADRGINQFVSRQQWQAIVDALTAKVKAGDTEQGFLDCIRQCGELLQKHVPATGEKNELPNHLVIL